MLKKDQLWFSDRYTKEDKMNVTWDHRWTDGKMDSRNSEEHALSLDNQPFRSLLRAPIIMKRCDAFDDQEIPGGENPDW